MKSKTLESENKTLLSGTIRQRHETFKNKYKPTRSQIFGFDQSINNMHNSTKHTKELIYHSLRDAFCFTYEAVLPETYSGYLNLKQRMSL